MVFAGAWAIIGGILALLTSAANPDSGLLGWVVGHMFMYALLGGISGLVTALLVARAETGRQLQQLVPGRFVVWGVLGGLAPVVIFGLTGLVIGASTEALLALAALGGVNAVLGGAVAASAATVAKRGELVSLPPDQAASSIPRIPE